MNFFFLALLLPCMSATRLATGYRDFSMQGEPLWIVPERDAWMFPQTPGMAVKWHNGTISYIRARTPNGQQPLTSHLQSRSSATVPQNGRQSVLTSSGNDSIERGRSHTRYSTRATVSKNRGQSESVKRGSSSTHSSGSRSSSTVSSGSARGSGSVVCHDNRPKALPLPLSQIQRYVDTSRVSSSNGESIWANAGGPQLVHNIMCVARVSDTILQLKSLFMIVTRIFGSEIQRWPSIRTQAHQVCSKHESDVALYLRDEYREDWDQARTLRYAGEVSILHWNLHFACPKIRNDPIALRYIILQRVISAIRNRQLSQSDKLHFDRDKVLSKTVDYFGNLSTDFSSKFLFMVGFNEEDGLDLGGVRTEWFNLFGKGLIREKYVRRSGNFMTVNAAKTRGNERVFVTFGRMLAFSLLFDTYLGIPISLGIVKFLLNEKVALADLRIEDPDMYRQINRPASELETLDLVFTATDGYGKEHELIPRGSRMPVDRRNADKWKKKMAQWQLVGRVHEGLVGIRRGFQSILEPKEIFYGIQALDLVKVFAGASTVATKSDFQQMMKFVLQGRFGTTHDAPPQQVSQFWAMIDSLSPTQRTQLMEFATASPVVDLKKITIAFMDFPAVRRIYTSNDHAFPIAYTCTRTINVPLYSSLEVMKAKFALALEHGNGNIGRE